jgi:predicted alpha/beta-fold hydrolase
MRLFQPLPFLSNPHVQTILGNLLKGQARPPRSGTLLVPLPDGDKIVLFETPPRRRIGAERIALLLHGLGGCRRSPYMERMTHRLSGLGWRVLRMELRGAGAGIKLARRLYNAACSDDVRAVVEFLATAFPAVPLAVVGYSLGGNIALKYAGELGAQTPPTLRALATLAPPIDLVRCSALIARYPFYDAYYRRHLVQHVMLHQQYFPDLPRASFPRGSTLRQFDDIYTAPRGGYADVLDYYRQASAQRWIPRITLPTFILTARDDPFVAVAPFEELSVPPAVELHITAHGGHVGFLGADGAGGIRWAEAQLMNWLEKQVASRPVC